MPQMLLLVDECVPESVTKFFRERGHVVRLVRELFPPRTPDPIIAKKADDMSAIIVTWNTRDFRKLVARIPEGNAACLRRCGRICFRVKEQEGRRYAEKWIDDIEYHYEKAQRERDKRLLIEITATGMHIIR